MSSLCPESLGHSRATLPSCDLLHIRSRWSNDDSRRSTARRDFRWRVCQQRLPSRENPSRERRIIICAAKYHERRRPGLVAEENSRVAATRSSYQSPRELRSAITERSQVNPTRCSQLRNETSRSSGTRSRPSVRHDSSGMFARSAKPASAQAITARPESRQQIPQRPLGALETQTTGRIRLENGWLSDGEKNFASGRRGFEH